MNNYLLLLLITLPFSLPAQEIPLRIQSDIDRGKYSSAESAMRQLLNADSLPVSAVLKFNFEIERLRRIQKDFSRSEEEIIARLKKYFPSMTAETLQKFESDKSLEYKIINGKKRYFNNAASNLFLINKEAKKVKEAADGKPERKLDLFLDKHLSGILAEFDKTGRRFLNPVTMTLNYSVTVKPDAVPAGEVIRCWLPFPREYRSRQAGVELISASEKHYILADASTLQRTMYMEKKSVKDQPTVFSMKLKFTSSAEYFNIFGKQTGSHPPLSADSMKEFTAERPPHIVFTPDIRKISAEIVGAEINPAKKAQRIFTWISDNVPWASALEYSTIPNISAYCLENMHGDCGIQTLLFMTLCRYSGIPAKWQSGWMLHPPEVNLHDWCEIFLDGFGWVPVDQSFGLQESPDERKKFFYLGGIDPYRFIVNDDYARDLFPAKMFPRSETVDFQRGELEWRGGNLYFDQWKYTMKVEWEKTP